MSNTSKGLMLSGKFFTPFINNKRVTRFLKSYQLYIMLLPALAYFIIFKYLPMYGVQIAFRDYYPNKGFMESPWVGLEHFLRFFRSSEIFIILKNTFTLNIYQLAVGFPFPIMIALMLHNAGNLKFKKIVQTTLYAPYFISTVVLVGMILIFLSPRSGIVNHFLVVLGFEPIFFMAKKELFKTIFVFTGIWQRAGWNSIIYIGALSSINPEQHESATVDGASRLQRVFHIDLPGIMPTAVIMLILNSGRLLQLGFEKVYLMQNDLNRKASEVISTYVYKVGLQHADYSYSAAIGLFEAIVSLIILIAVNRIARNVSESSLW